MALFLRPAGLSQNPEISEKLLEPLLDRLEEKMGTLQASPPGFLRILDDEDALTAVVDGASTLPATGVWVILGIGGSALGARALRDALAPDQRDRLLILDNIDPDSLARVSDRLILEDTRFLVVSKSGTTAETAAQLLFFHRRLLDAGLDPWKHLIAITDPKEGLLRELVNREGIPSFDVPADVGGRFSVLTAVGLLPALLLGLDARALVSGAREMWNSLRTGGPGHPVMRWVAEGHLRGVESRQLTQVMISYSDRLQTFGDWFAQLWAESLGKRLDLHGKEVHRGSTPLIARGATDQHSLVQLFAEGPADKQFLVVSCDRETDLALPLKGEGIARDLDYLLGHSFGDLLDAEREGTAGALRAGGRPVAELHFGALDEAHLGASFLLFQIATVLAGELLEVDPYDQPGVEAGKILAFSRMGRSDAHQEARKILGDVTSPPPAVQLPPN